MNPKELAYCTVANQFGEVFAMKADRFFRPDVLRRLAWLSQEHYMILGNPPTKIYLSGDDHLEILHRSGNNFVQVTPQPKAAWMFCGLQVMSVNADKTRVE